MVGKGVGLGAVWSSIFCWCENKNIGWDGYFVFKPVLSS